MISITAAPEAPPPRIRILDSRQREVETVRIGDRLTFRIEIPEDSKFILNTYTVTGIFLIYIFFISINLWNKYNKNATFHFIENSFNW